MSDKLNQSGVPAGDDRMHPMAAMLFGWVGAPWAGRLVFWGMALLSIALLAVDFFVHRHVKEDIEAYAGFYGIYGFVAFGFVVLMGWPLGRLLRRDENYYGDADTSEDDG